MNTTTTTTKEHIENLIACANGASEMHRTSIFCKWIYHTSSVEAVCKAAKSYWLLDVIVSHLPKLAQRGARFQVWRMTVKPNHEARVWCEDGNGNKLKAQIIPFTDFPLSEIELFCEYGSVDGENPAYIIMLPGDR